jgi:hypothetical protein
MQSSQLALDVSNELISSLLKEELRLFTSLSYFMKMKGKIGEKLMKIEANEANIRKCQLQSELLDREMIPILNNHQKVVDKLRSLGVVVTHK